MADSESQLVAAIRRALDAADLDAFGELVDPRVTWGAPGDPAPPCRNRRQVLQWYQRGRAAGRQARVIDITTHGDKILVALAVTDTTAGAAEADRWQVLTVADGKIRDIRGYDRRDLAVAAAGLSS